jgi:hypothetical protein
LINWKDVLVAQQMREDALAHAQMERLALQARDRKSQRSQAQRRLAWVSERYRLWMARLGDRLVAWGQRLKARYVPSGIADVASGAWGTAQQQRCEIESDLRCC